MNSEIEQQQYGEVKEHLEAIQNFGIKLRVRAFDEEIQDGAKMYLEVLQQKLADTFTNILGGKKFVTLNYPSGFHYVTEVENNFNEKSMQDVDHIVSAATSNGILSLSNEYFSVLYDQILRNVEYTLSQEDFEEKKKEAKNINDTRSAAEAAWEQDMGKPIDEDDLKTVYEVKPKGKKTKIFYINYTVKENWGKASNIPKRDYPNFKPKYIDYLNLIENSISESEADALNRLETARDNVEHPSEENGGLDIGNSRYYVGYQIPDPNTIKSSLIHDANKIKVNFSMEHLNSKETTISIEGKASLQIPVEKIITISGDVGTTFSLDKYSKDSTSAKITMEYVGVTLIGIVPHILSVSGETGWYENQIIRDIVEKDSSKTGYKLRGSTINFDELFGSGKKFCRLNTLVISQDPTIQITLTRADEDLVKTDFVVKGEVKLDILGLSAIGGSATASGNVDFQIHNVKSDPINEEITITLSPSQNDETPEEEKTAYILGGVIEHPPNSELASKRS